MINQSITKRNIATILKLIRDEARVRRLAGNVQSTIPTPVVTTARNGEWILLKINCHYPLDALLTLISHEIHRHKQRLPKAKKHAQTDQMRLKARRLQTEGKSLGKIAKLLYPKEFAELSGKAMTAKIDSEFRELARKYFRTTGNWPEAEKRAEKTVGVDRRSIAAKIKPLTQRVRYLLKQK